MMAIGLTQAMRLRCVGAMEPRLHADVDDHPIRFP